MRMTQVDLDTESCGNPDCTSDHMFLRLGARCHPEAALLVGYNKPTGTLLIACAKCEHAIAEIAVAAR